jgi:acyl-CoA thioesterase
MNNLQEAKQYFSGDLYATDTTGIEILAVDDGYAKCSLRIEEKHKNAVGQVMGGVFFVMADFAFAVAANFHQPTTVTQSSQITFLAPAKGKILYAETEKIRGGKRTCFYKISIYDDTGENVAYVTTSGYVVG